MSRVTRSRTSQAGFTLIELMVTLAVAAVLATIAAPNLRSFILNNRLTATATEMLRTIQTARAEATKRQQSIVVCTSANPTIAAATCSKTNIAGWIVFEDKNNDWERDTSTEELLETHTFDPTKVFVLADKSKRLSFAATGFANPAGAETPSESIVMCDSRGNVDIGGQSAARGFLITKTGRARITRVVSDIDGLLVSTKINSTCPP